MSYPVSAGGVTPVKRAIDIVARKTNIGTVSLMLRNDAVVEGLVTGTRLKNKKCSIKIGFADIAEGAFEDYHTGVIAKTPKFIDSHYTLDVASLMILPRDFKVKNYFFNKHPLEIMKSVIDDSGIDSSFYNSAEYDPESGTYSGTSSHYCISIGDSPYYEDNTIREPVEGKKILDEMLLIMNGQLTDDESGKLRFEEFSTGKSVSDSWTDDDIRDFKIVDFDANIANRVEVSFGKFRTDYTGIRYPEPPMSVYESNNTDSQSALAYPGGSNFIASRKLNSEWMNGIGALTEDLGTSSPASFGIGKFNIDGFCGARWPGFPGGSQHASSILTVARTGFIKIEDELIEIQALSINNSFKRQESVWSPEDGLIDVVWRPWYAEVTVKTRGAKGTTPAVHEPSWDAGEILVFDYTMAVNIAENIINRFSYGAKVIEVTTNLSKYAIQLMDFITITSSRYRGFGESSLTTGVKWQVIGKELILGESDTNIRWTLAWATESSPPAVSFAQKVLGSKLGDIAHKSKMTTKSEVVEAHVVGGLLVTDAGTLDIEISVGVARGDGGSAYNDSTRTITLTADKDNYIVWNIPNNQPIVYETTLGAGTPTILGGDTWLAKVVTSSGPDDIDSVTDLRETEALDGVKLKSQTVDTAQLADDCIVSRTIGAAAIDDSAFFDSGVVVEAAIGPGAITEGKIGPGAVTENKLGVGAVTSGKLGSGSVIAGKVAVGGVSASNQIANSVVDSDQLAGNSVIAGKIAASAVEAGDIASGGISAAAQFASQVVETAAIKDLNITTGKVAASAITTAKHSTPVAFKAYASAATSLGSKAWTVVQFNQEVYDTGEDFDKATNYDFTMPSDLKGYVLFSAAVQIPSAVADVYYEMSLFVGGVQTADLDRHHVPAAEGGETVLLNGTTALELSAAETVTLRVFNDDTSSINTGTGLTNVWFCGQEIR
jgi:hypothetical protein